MGFVRNKMAGRFPALGRLGDVVLVAGFMLWFLNRRGLVSDEMAAKLGAPSSSGGAGISVSEMALVGAAALRLAKGVRNRRA
ncbi:MAG: hypothetical protein HKN24_07940 [Acidimicrobiales bacterium]|nr:hypothetical protein [Acidimicrobiales bacterium]